MKHVKISVFKCHLFIVLFIPGVFLQTNDTGILNSENKLDDSLLGTSDAHILNSETKQEDSSPNNYNNGMHDEVKIEIFPAVNEGHQPVMNDSVGMDGFDHVDTSPSDVSLYAVGKFAHCFNLPTTCRTPSFLDVVLGCKEFGQFQSGEFEYVPVTPIQFNTDSIFDFWLCCTCFCLILSLKHAYITIFN